jgi:8-oxo-dGTP pyrophosphatase MutT (NUDIX family)
MRGNRSQYGGSHPDLVRLLATLTPAATETVTWPGSVLDVAAYLTPVAPPPELVTSVRCIVEVDDRVVVCETPNDTHVVPGGRREPGETFEATARREVHEETGWLINESDLRLIGFLYFRPTEALLDDNPHLPPGFLQVVYTAPARAHHTEPAAHWTDVEGWESGHRLLSASELDQIQLPAVQRAFLRAAGITG